MKKDDEQVDYISMLSPTERKAFDKIKRPIANEDLFSLAHLKECIVFYRPTDQTIRSHTHYPPIITALHDCDSLPSSEDYSDESESVRAQCQAFVTVLDGAIRWGTSGSLTWMPSTYRGASWKFNDARFVRLILTVPESAERIVAIIKERGTYDFDVINTILNSDAPVISDGSL